MKVLKIVASPIGLYHSNVTVTWGVKFQKTRDKVIQFDIHYLLNCYENEYKILLYISDEDQEQLMAEDGLL